MARVEPGRGVRRSGSRPGGHRSVHVQRLRPRDGGRVVPQAAQAEVARCQAWTDHEEGWLRQLISDRRRDDARRTRAADGPGMARGAHVATVPPAGPSHDAVARARGAADRLPDTARSRARRPPPALARRGCSRPDYRPALVRRGCSRRHRAADQLLGTAVARAPPAPPDGARSPASPPSSPPGSDTCRHHGADRPAARAAHRPRRSCILRRNATGAFRHATRRPRPQN